MVDAPPVAPSSDPSSGVSSGASPLSVREGSHHERPSAGQHTAGIGRAAGIAEGEVHAPVQTERLALLEVAPGVLEGLGAGHAHRVETGGAANRRQLILK